MEAFLQERPELNTHVTGLKEDIADLIKVLSEKLTTDSDAEAAIDEEVSTYTNISLISVQYQFNISLISVNISL